MNRYLKYSLALVILSVFVFSCKKDLEDPGGTSTEKLAGEWWVQLYNPDGTAAYPSNYRGHLYTYNTAANNNELWIDDYSDASGNVLWDFKVKAQADVSNLTFQAKDAVSVVPNYGIKVNITEGKVIPLAGRSKTGNVADSIYMKVEFSDDPGTIYTIKGHQRTGFIEDEY